MVWMTLLPADLGGTRGWFALEIPVGLYLRVPMINEQLEKPLSAKRRLSQTDRVWIMHGANVHNKFMMMDLVVNSLGPLCSLSKRVASRAGNSFESTSHSFCCAMSVVHNPFRHNNDSCSSKSSCSSLSQRQYSRYHDSGEFSKDLPPLNLQNPVNQPNNLGHPAAIDERIHPRHRLVPKQ